MSHTAGPWSATDAEWIMSQRTGMGFRYFPVRGEGQTWDICNVFADEDDDEMQANVRLVASAPEMLDALRLAADAIDLAQAQVDSDNDRYTLCKRLVAVKRVIAKAEGRND